MKDWFSTKRIVPLVTASMGVVWLVLGLTKYGFMGANKPGGGFFPAIIAVLLIIASIIAFVQDFKSEAPKYSLIYLHPIIAVLAILLLSNLLGMMISLLLFLFLWLKLYENTSWTFSIVFSVSTMVVVYLVFAFWLDVPFPKGFLGF